MYEALRRRLDLPCIPALDGLRAISAFLVVFYHAGIHVSGPLGVLIFFVLSGFLITWLLLKEDERCGTVSLRGFYRRRAFRIFPAFYCFWIVGIAMRMLRGGSVSWPTAWSSFFYYANYHHGIVRPEDQYMLHTWSLAVEEQFYLCWPLIFLTFRKNRARLAWVTLGIIAATCAHRTMLCLTGTPYQYTRYTFDCRADGLLWGCVTAIALRAGFLRSFWTVVCSRSWLPVIPAVGIALVAQTGLPDMVTLAAVPPMVAVLICQLVVHSDAGLWRWLNSGVARYFGLISYPLYLYNGVGIGITSRFPINRPVDVSLIVLIAVAMASASYFFVEKPFLKYKTATPRTRAVAA